MSGAVMDASAVLALVHAEPGSDVVRAAIEGAVISTVNWSEVCRSAASHDVGPGVLRPKLLSLGLELVAFSELDAEATAELWPRTRSAGLSLADRACLALAQRLGRPALTADRSWLELNLGIEVRSIR